ncbi:C40 family peptidase [Spirillospora sp. NPDC127200]
MSGLTCALANAGEAADAPRIKNSSRQLTRSQLKAAKAYLAYRAQEAQQKRRAKTAVKFALRQRGKPYRWGATGPHAFDCSGLATTAWRKAGVQLPRVTYAQYKAVRRKVGFSHLLPGDLVFFNGKGHVGIYVGNQRFVHAPRTGTTIRVDALRGYRKRSFSGAVRPAAPAARVWPASIRKLAHQEARTEPNRTEPKKKPVQPEDSRPGSPADEPQPHPAFPDLVPEQLPMPGTGS